MGEIGIAVVDRLVLADQAAQLLAETARAGLERRVGQTLVGQDGPGGLDQQHQAEGEQHLSHDRFSASMRGRISCFSTSAVTGPA